MPPLANSPHTPSVPALRPGWLFLLVIVLATVLNASALRAAWSANLAYLRLDVLLNHASRGVSLQGPASAQDWPPAGLPAAATARFVSAYGLGLTHLALQQYAPAVAAFQTAQTANPLSSDAHALLGDAYHALGDDTQAAAEWQATQALPFLMSRGDQSVAAGDWTGAVRWYQLATQVSPSSAAAFLQLSRAYGAAGQRQAALDALLTAVNLAPDDVMIRHTLGLTYLGQGAYAAAEAQFQRVLAVAPNDYYTNLYLVTTELALGRVDAAETYAQTAARLAPADPRTHAALGSVYFRRMQWPAAITEFQRALGLVAAWNRQSTLTLSPADQASYHLSLARAYQSASQPDAAIAEYQAVLALDPKNAAALAALKTRAAPGHP